jgi:hypothetical protein
MHNLLKGRLYASICTHTHIGIFTYKGLRDE